MVMSRDQNKKKQKKTNRKIQKIKSKINILIISIVQNIRDFTLFENKIKAQVIGKTIIET